MSIEYYQGGIEVELTSHNGPIVSRTMPQDFEYRGSSTGEEGNSSARRNDTMHQPRRSYDGSSALPIKPVMSFGDALDSDSMVGTNTSEVSAIWDAPPSGTEKENESSRFLRSYEKRPAPAPSSSSRSLKGRDMDERSTFSNYSHSELDDDASDISGSAMGSLRRRNRISQIHAERLMRWQQRDKLETKKKPLRAKTSINEIKPPNSNLSEPKNVSFGAKAEASKRKPNSIESKLLKVTPPKTSLFQSTDSSSASTSTEEISHGPLAPNAKRTIGEGKFKFDVPSGSSSVTTKSSATSNSPDRSVATQWTNLTYSTVGSGRVYRTQIICTRKYKRSVMAKVVNLNPDDLQIGRILEGLENGFIEQDDFAHALITALFERDIKKEPLHILKQWKMENSTLSRLQDNTGKPEEVAESASDTTPTTTTAAFEESAHGECAKILVSPPPTKRMTAAFDIGKPPLTPKETGYIRFLVEKTASLQYKDVFGMASAKGIIHFYEDRDEIWIEDYTFSFASRRFKFLSGGS